jgi:hypothetical protein
MQRAWWTSSTPATLARTPLVLHKGILHPLHNYSSSRRNGVPPSLLMWCRYWGQVSTAYAAETVESADAYLLAGAVFNDYTTTGWTLLMKDTKVTPCSSCMAIDSQTQAKCSRCCACGALVLLCRRPLRIA